MPGSIFLSHTHEDKEFVRKIFSDLLTRGFHAWLDEAEIGPGESLIAKIEEGIDRMDYLGVVLSEHSVQSDWVLREVRMALVQEIRGRKVKVIPLVIEDCRLPGFLLDKLYIDFRDRSADTYQKGLALLARALEGKRPELPKSGRVLFIDATEGVPTDARIFRGSKIDKSTILSVSRALSDRQFEGLHNMRLGRDTVNSRSRVFYKTDAVQWIGGPTWEASRCFDELLQFGFFLESTQPRRASHPERLYEYTPLFWKMTNLMAELAVGRLKPSEGALGPGYWLGSAAAPWPPNRALERTGE